MDSDSENENFNNYESEDPTSKDFFNGQFGASFYENFKFVAPQPTPTVNSIMPSIISIRDMTGTLSIGNTTTIINVNSANESNLESKIKNTESLCKVKESLLQSTEEVNSFHFKIVAEHIAQDWKIMALSLPSLLPDTPKYEDSHLTTFWMDKPLYGSTELMVSAILEKWKNWNGPAATVGVLAKTLKDINRPELANKLDEISN